MEEWNKVVAANLSSMFISCREVLPIMCRQKYGRTVNISSASGRDGGHHGGAHYVTTKGAAASLSKHFAKQAAVDGATVNCEDIYPIRAHGLESIEELLGKYGAEPEDVTKIFLTCLHYDRSWNLGYFPNAQLCA